MGNIFALLDPTESDMDVDPTHCTKLMSLKTSQSLDFRSSDLSFHITQLQFSNSPPWRLDEVQFSNSPPWRLDEVQFSNSPPWRLDEVQFCHFLPWRLDEVRPRLWSRGREGGRRTSRRRCSPRPTCRWGSSTPSSPIARLYQRK